MAEQNRTRPPGASGPPDLDAESYYDLLGVPFGASTSELAKAYRAAMKRTHPDRQRADRRAAAEERAKRLNLAYATLSHPEKRRAYDQTIRQQTIQDQVMRQYVTGSFYPGWAADAEARDAALRRERTAAERAEVRQADRSALVSLLLVFGGLTLAVLTVLLLLGLAESLLGRLF